MRDKEDCAPGKQTALSAEHELSLCNYIEYMANRVFPLALAQILMYAALIADPGDIFLEREDLVSDGG
jgi:hypothetical protein